MPLVRRIMAVSVMAAHGVFVEMGYVGGMTLGFDFALCMMQVITVALSNWIRFCLEEQHKLCSVTVVHVIHCNVFGSAPPVSIDSFVCSGFDLDWSINGPRHRGATG